MTWKKKETYGKQIFDNEVQPSGFGSLTIFLPENPSISLRLIIEGKQG